MRNYTRLPVYLFLILVCIGSGCEFFAVKKDRSDTFENIAERISVPAGRFDEASGLADSRTIKGYIWIHNDSGNPAELFLVSRDGKDIRSYPTPGVGNRDWEDIAVGPGPVSGVSYVFVGDFGNNNANPDVTVQSIYRMPELTKLDTGFDPSTISQISYSYPDGPHDAEALMVDPVTRDIYIVSKEFDGATLYRLPFPQAENSVLIAEKVGSVPEVVLATGADIAADGKEILVRTYSDIFYWRRSSNETVAQTLTRKPLKTVPYELEPQGEAVCFDSEMKGYFTFSERRDGINFTLNYYRRK